MGCLPLRQGSKMSALAVGKIRFLQLRGRGFPNGGLASLPTGREYRAICSDRCSIAQSLRNRGLVIRSHEPSLSLPEDGLKAQIEADSFIISFPEGETQTLS